MGRPRINRSLPKYASEFVDRHGKPRVRLRKSGFQTVYLTVKPGTPEFTQQYHSWLKGGKIEAGAARVVRGTFDDLIMRYYASPQWKNIPKDSTRKVYRGVFERIRARIGSRQVSGMTARHVSNWMQELGKTPSAANILKKRLSQLFDFAIILGFRVDNPTKAVRGYSVTGGGFQTWQEEQIEAFEATHPVGSKARLALALLLYTAQRRSDVCVMGHQHVKDGHIRVKQLKTGTELTIPIHNRLKEAIAACPSGHLSFLVSERGAPYTKESFGNWFRKQCDKAGLGGFSAHGLRKAAARRMAELGLSNQVIKSITGHKSDSEIARYTADANQVVMADVAIVALERRDLANVDPEVSQNRP